MLRRISKKYIKWKTAFLVNMYAFMQFLEIINYEKTKKTHSTLVEISQMHIRRALALIFLSLFTCSCNSY